MANSSAGDKARRAVDWISKRAQNYRVKSTIQLTRIVFNQLGDRCGLLLLSNLFVLLLVGGRLETLPRKGTSEEVEEHVSETFEIVSSRLL
jgi:hypothetical protein